MFGGNSRRQPRNGGVESSSEPLLEEEDIVVFDIQDSDTDSLDHTRHWDDAPRVGPPLRSTVASREAEYELDSNALDEDPEHDQLHSSSMPLLVGLVDTSAARGASPDIPMHHSDYDGVTAAHEPDVHSTLSKHHAGGGMLESVSNMANSILGAGIIGLPYAVMEAGFFTGLVLLVMICIVTDWTIRLIILNAKLSGRSSYIDIMDQCFGPTGRAAVSLFQFAFAFGGMCAFGIIIGDTIPHVIRFVFPGFHDVPILWVFTNRQFIIAFCTICVSYPLSLYRDISKLARASGLALVGMTIIVISVLIEREHVTDDLKGSATARFTILEPRVFQAIGVISFAFVCHHNSLLIYGSLRTPTLDRFATVTHMSTAISLVACLTLAISAFIVFTDKTQGNILNNFSPDDPVINIARFAFGLNMFTTLPLELFVCREVLEHYFFSHKAFNPQRHLLFTTSILFASMIVALVTCDLGVMLEITGGISATALAFIFPAACFLKLGPKNLPWYSREKLPAFTCVSFGGLVLVLSLFFALQKSWTPAGDAKICLT